MRLFQYKLSLYKAIIGYPVSRVYKCFRSNSARDISCYSKLVTFIAFKWYMSRLMTKPTKWLCAQRRHRSVWASAQSQSLRCTHEECFGPLLPTERTAKTDQTGRMPRLIWVFAGRTVILLCLSWGGSYDAACSLTRKILCSVVYCRCVLQYSFE